MEEIHLTFNRLIYPNMINIYYTNEYQSTVSLYPYSSKISGATYSGVPHVVYVILLNLIFDNPKSVNLICPN